MKNTDPQTTHENSVTMSYVSTVTHIDTITEKDSFDLKTPCSLRYNCECKPKAAEQPTLNTSCWFYLFPLGLYVFITFIQLYRFKQKFFSKQDLMSLKARITNHLETYIKSIESEEIQFKIAKKRFAHLIPHLEVKLQKEYEEKLENQKNSNELKELNEKIYNAIIDKNSLVDEYGYYYLQVMQPDLRALVINAFDAQKKGAKKPKNSTVLFHLIVNLLAGVLCLALSYYLFLGIDINYVFITLLMSLLVVFGLLFRFFKNY